MEENARDDASDLLSYLDLKFWDRGNEPEPKCAAYMYYSSSCAALGTSWASHCSEGGKKVFPKSCNGLFTEGAKACGFLSFGCSSMCYKINTDGCDCDALNYTPQLKTGYCDTPLSSTVESGMGQCRTKCSSTAGCVG
ncbi:hypothetical protein BKA62DRAFT_417516 [Auriculariales sp. MPI-PUGE-AT-0066]|nr:hypothetical protein BKA62DRAFT_417516 [Auriculariales sp. MPI-PUGE-AT-0066]